MKKTAKKVAKKTPRKAPRKAPRKRPQTTTEQFEAAAKRATSGQYHLRLYITGTTPQSQRALANIKRICEEHLKGRYELEVIDIYQRPTLARDEQILAAPTLIKLLPHPLRRFIGDLSDSGRVLFGLDLQAKLPRTRK